MIKLHKRNFILGQQNELAWSPHEVLRSEVKIDVKGSVGSSPAGVEILPSKFKEPVWQS